MRRFFSVLPVLVLVCSSVAQETTSVRPPGTVDVKSSRLASYKERTNVDAKAFLFRNVAEGFKPMLGGSHKRFVHALVVTNIESATCETSLLHWEKGRGIALDAAVTGESRFLAVFHASFPNEPEYAYMGEDHFVLTEPGLEVIEGHGAIKLAKGSKEEEASRGWDRMSRNEQFALLSRWFEPIWPLRPYKTRVITLTIEGQKESSDGVIISALPPNALSFRGETKDLIVAGVDVPVTTCK